jgi:hypothetical protein
MALFGCSTASSIQKANQSESTFDSAVFDGETTIIRDDIPDSDAYRVFHQAATGFVSVQSIRNSAEKRANDFCENKSKRVEVIRETTSKPPHILGNFPRIEIVFTCIESKINAQNSIASDKYDQLRKLKSLLDDGIISTDEYENEKSKLLSK